MESLTWSSCIEAGVVGLKWTKLDSKPEGTQVICQELSQALLQDTVVDRNLLKKFNLYGRLQWDSFVKAGNAWYQPDKAGKAWFVPMGVDDNCPFVAFISVGAFVYFNYRYDVVGINAMRFTELRRDEEKTPAKMFYGEGSPLPQSVIRPLEEAGRWQEVTVPTIRDYGFTGYTWILPSEFISDHIFPKDGGFAYKHKREANSRYYPMVPLEGGSQELVLSPIEYKSELQVPEITQWLMQLKLPKGERPTLSPDKFSNHDKFAPKNPSVEMKFGEGTSAASGLEKLLGFRSHELTEHLREMTLKAVWALNQPKGLEQIEKEGFAKVDDILKAMQRNRQARDMPEPEENHDGNALRPDPLMAMHFEMQLAVYGSGRSDGEEEPLAKKSDMFNLVQVFYQEARERQVKSNASSGAETTMDKGRRGETLVDFFLSPQARKCNLSIEEVAALRLYTTSTYNLINKPLRDEVKPHPLAITTSFLYNGLKKLRGLNFSQGTK